MSKPTVAVSAPGKVLFTGGFLVLDRKHNGLVFGLNARIHVHIQPWYQNGLDNDLSSEQQGGYTLVQSPQFNDAKWLYKIGGLPDSNSGAVNAVQVLE